MAWTDDRQIIAAVLDGDEAAFSALFERYQGSLVRAALAYVSSPDLAEEVAQETWIAVLKGLSRFEGRSSLKTWIFSILVNRAKTLAQREVRYQPFELDGADDDPVEPLDRFYPDDHPQRAGHWQSAPRAWEDIPEQRLLSNEVQALIRDTIHNLPPSQRMVITLRDVEHVPSEDVCNILGISETNQRVLLHRGRARVRRALEQYFGE